MDFFTFMFVAVIVALFFLGAYIGHVTGSVFLMFLFWGLCTAFFIWLARRTTKAYKAKTAKKAQEKLERDLSYVRAKRDESWECLRNAKKELSLLEERKGQMSIEAYNSQKTQLLNKISIWEKDYAEYEKRVYELL